MKFKKLFDKITLFSEIVKIIFEPFWQIPNISHLASGDQNIRSVDDAGKMLMHQRLDFIRTQGNVVDSDIINQAGEQTVHIKILAGADVHTAIG